MGMPARWSSQPPAASEPTPPPGSSAPDPICDHAISRAAALGTGAKNSRKMTTKLRHEASSRTTATATSAGFIAVISRTTGRRSGTASNAVAAQTAEHQHGEHPAAQVVAFELLHRCGLHRWLASRRSRREHRNVGGGWHRGASGRRGGGHGSDLASPARGRDSGDHRGPGGGAGDELGHRPPAQDPGFAGRS